MHTLADLAPARLRGMIEHLSLDEKRALRDVLTLETEPLTALAALTPREREILDRVMLGCTNKEIGKQLGISPRTVETHRGRIAEKLGVRSTASLVRKACELGVDPRMPNTAAALRSAVASLRRQ